MVLDVWYGLKSGIKKRGFKNKRRKRKKQEKNGESKTNPTRYAKREMRPCVCEQTIWQCTGQGLQGRRTETARHPVRMVWGVKVRGIALDSKVCGIIRVEAAVGNDIRPPLERVGITV